jgi:hypothetical protein
VAVATHMTVDELSLALAMYCKLHGENPRVARRHLDSTPKMHFDEGVVWAESNAKTINLVGSDPAAIGEGGFSLNQARGWFSRLIGLGRSRGATAPDDDELESVMSDLAKTDRTMDAAKAKKIAALRELVDESFDSA